MSKRDKTSGVKSRLLRKKQHPHSDLGDPARQTENAILLQENDKDFSIERLADNVKIEEVIRQRQLTKLEVSVIETLNVLQRMCSYATTELGYEDKDKDTSETLTVLCSLERLLQQLVAKKKTAEESLRQNEIDIRKVVLESGEKVGKSVWLVLLFTA
jgi:hypothetical protein